jgi:primase-polymerase (primpol)-like protein
VTAATTGAPPGTLPVNPDGIAAELMARPQWVSWGWEWVADDQRWTKVPYDSKTGMRASSTNPATWATIEAALAYTQRESLPGIGFVVTADDPYVGIDLDKCRDPQTSAIAPWAAEIVARFDSYTEITPTGTGLRVWITTESGLLPDGVKGRRKGGIEVYAAGRFFTVTGQRIDGAAR